MKYSDVFKCIPEPKLMTQFCVFNSFSFLLLYYLSSCLVPLIKSTPLIKGQNYNTDCDCTPQKISTTSSLHLAVNVLLYLFSSSPSPSSTPTSCPLNTSLYFTCTFFFPLTAASKPLNTSLYCYYLPFPSLHFTFYLPILYHTSNSPITFQRSTLPSFLRYLPLSLL